VILMHGWGGFGAQMQAFVEPLVRGGFRAITFDALSHGGSDAGADGARQSNFFEFRDVLLELSRRVEPLAGVIAHSGGCTAVGTALRAGWRVPAAVFIAPMASPLMYQRVFQQALGLSDDVLRRFHANVEERLSFRWEDLEMPLIPKTVATPPVLVIHDRDDRETSWREGATIAEAWPDARLVTTRELGHRRLLRDVSVVEEVVGFVAARR
jgi:pimeloyl-ACP methyl ester carboxylesterase